MGHDPPKKVAVIRSPIPENRPAHSFPRMRSLKSLPGARGSRSRGADLAFPLL